MGLLRSNRLGWLPLLGGLALAGCLADNTQPTVPPPPVPVTGPAVPEMTALDRSIATLMGNWGIPGGAVAVTYRGRLVYARGFGYADTVTKRLVEPSARFRIASISKPITAVALLTLVEAGKVSLSATAFPLLTDLHPPAGQAADPRLDSITVAQLLTHTSGFNSGISGDPIYQSQAVATSLGIAGPPTARDLTSFIMGRPLDFRPGLVFSYSNIGYVVLGRVIEAASGQPYDTFVKAMLARAGISRMEIARTRRALRPADEVSYYDPGVGPSVFPGEPDGSLAETGLYFEGADAAGGWIASVVDLARFLSAIDGGAERPDLLLPATVVTMLEPPPRVWDGSPYHYALGWLVRPTFGNWWHDGSTYGTASFAGRFGDNLTVAAVFNAREMGANSLFQALIEQALGDGLQLTAWPTGDLFSQFP